MSMKHCQKVILEECAQALESIDEAQSEQLIGAILSAEKIYFCGVGRVMSSLQSICKRLAHLGLDTHCVGDVTEPAATPNDLLIVASGSGESLFPKAMAEKAKALNVKIAWIGSNVDSSIARLADIRVRIPVQSKLYREDEIVSRQPMTSLFEQALLLFGDAIAMEIIERRQIRIKELWQYHANLE